MERDSGEDGFLLHWLARDGRDAAGRLRVGRLSSFDSAAWQGGGVESMKLASFEAVIGALHDAGARYLVAGGLAVCAHGYLRFTRGVDLVVRLVPDNVERVFSALRFLGYGPAVPVTAEQFADTAYRQGRIAERDMQALGFRSDRHRDTPINLFAPMLFCFDDEYRRALVKALHGAIAVRFICSEALIRMKEATGRLADLADAEQLRLALKVDDPVELQPGQFDSRLTTWEGSRREQLRRWAALPLERTILAIEEMQEVSDQFRQTPDADPSQATRSGQIASPAGEAHAVREPAPQYPRGESGGEVVPGGDSSGTQEEPRRVFQAPRDNTGDRK